MKNEQFLPDAGARPAPGAVCPKAFKVLALAVCAGLLAGCAHRYDMTLTNGGRITNVTKPILDKGQGVFTYKDVAGRVRNVSAGRVVEIAPHSKKNVTPGTFQ